jgi:hypothetical protein
MATTAPPIRDIGTTDLYWGTWGQGLLTDWWETTADLIWPNSVITYGRMRHDPQLRAVLNAYLLPILRATWAVDPAGCRDEVVQHVADDLGLPVLESGDEPGPARRRGVSWARHLRQALYDHLVYGHMPFELRYRVDGTSPGDCHLDHLGARMPWTLAQIHLNPDSTIREVVQVTQAEPIPANRLVWYVNQQEGANWAGISMLRPCFGAWLLKHETWRVHATSIRRFGMGVPSVEAPPGGTAAQVQEANALASGMRAGDSSGIGLPQGYKFSLTGITGSVPDALAFIRYLDQAMAKSALAGLIELGQTETGSRALGETFLDLFLLSLQAVADEIGETATSGQDGLPGIVTDLVDQNWGEDEAAPRLVCTDVGENYLVTAEALSRLTQYGALTPDPALDAWIRKAWRLPERDDPWEPSSRGLIQGPGGTPPAGGPGAAPDAGPAPGTPPAPEGGQPGPAGPPAARSRRRSGRRSIAAAGAPRRHLTPREVQAGWVPADHQAEWEQARAALLDAYRPVIRDQRNALVDEVIAQVQGGHTDRLGSLAVSTSEGTKVIAAAMRHLADLAAMRMMTEAGGQGVSIPADRVKINRGKLARVAVARAQLIGTWQATAAGTKALQVVRAAKVKPLDLMEQALLAGDDITQYLAGLSDTPLIDQLGAALTAAQALGREATLEAVLADLNAPAVYVATEVLDDNTCGPCEELDGTEFASLDEAEAAYPAGGYLDCEGGMRCRGTFIALFGEEGGG